MLVDTRNAEKSVWEGATEIARVCAREMDSFRLSSSKRRRVLALTIVDVHAYDIRFPTSRTLAGSDAMNNDPDYSAAYVVLQTDHPAGLEGHGLTFTIGRGNEVCVAAIRALAPLVIGRSLESFTSDMRAFWRHITGDSQLRWIGPEKGAIHLATAAGLGPLGQG